MKRFTIAFHLFSNDILLVFQNPSHEGNSYSLYRVLTLTTKHTRTLLKDDGSDNLYRVLT